MPLLECFTHNGRPKVHTRILPGSFGIADWLGSRQQQCTAQLGFVEFEKVTFPRSMAIEVQAKKPKAEKATRQMSGNIHSCIYLQFSAS